MNEGRLRELLRQLGLTQKEIETYLVILEAGETIVSTVTDEAGVSRRHVYTIAEQLEERNLIEINDFVNPTRLRALHPEDVKRQLLANANELQNLLDDHFEEPGIDFQQIEVVKSRVSLIKRLRKILRAADEQITIAIPTSVISNVEDELSDAVDRDVLVLLLLLDETTESLSRKEISFDGIAHAVHAHEREMAIQAAVDDNFGLIATPEILSNVGDQTQGITVADTHLEYVVAAAFYGDQWTFSDEIHVAEPDELPKTYRGFRLAVLQAMLHKKRDRRVYAKIKGYPKSGSKSSRSPERIEGEVVTVNQRMIEPVEHRPVSNLVIETDDGSVSIGSKRCIFEDYEAIRTRLEPM